VFIPAWAGQRVVYGHPCETIRSDLRREQVIAFWSGEMPEDKRCRFITENDVSYAFFGPRERAIGNYLPGGLGDPLFESEDTEVYRLSSFCSASD
jgi:hypothetical protein